MNCQRCNSERIVSARAKCSDMFSATVGEREHDGYVPDDLGVGGGDYLKIKYCLECGQLQGTWPKPKASLETLPKCPSECGYEGMPDDVRDAISNDFRRRMGFQCPSCEECFSADDWGL